jgi:hypothetical protein
LQAPKYAREFVQGETGRMISEHSGLVLGAIGVITAGAIGFVLSPVFLLKLLFEVDEPAGELILLTRHWGCMVFLLGLLLVWAAFEPWLRLPVVLAVITEKLMFGVLVWRSPLRRLKNLGRAALGDTILAVLLILWVLGL